MLVGRLTFGRRCLPTTVIAGMLVLSCLSASPVSAQEPHNITVILTEYQFSPKTITLTMGQPVLLNVQNQGKADHNLSSDDLPISNVKYLKADNSPADLERYEANNVLNADAGSGHTSMVTFTPIKVGTYGFFSEDEQKLGMVGTFVVVAPGGPAAGAGAAAGAPAAPAAPAPTTASTTVAKDGQSLASQSAATQAMFNAVWGSQAAQVWVREHNAALPQ
jgi:plastocyanin